MFFSEEKNQKTFAPAPADRLGPWPIRPTLHQTGNLTFLLKRRQAQHHAFGSCLQKRTASYRRGQRSGGGLIAVHEA
jgi:hypothetical protein